MTTDKTPPAPCDATCNDVQATCDAPVLGEAEMKAILDKIDMQLDAGYPLRVEEVQPLYRIASLLTARLRAAEERERALTEKLVALETNVRDVIGEGAVVISQGSMTQDQWNACRDAICAALSPSSQRAGDEGGTP